MKPSDDPVRLAESSIPIVGAVVRAGRTEAPGVARMNALSLGIAGKLGVLGVLGAGGAGGGLPGGAGGEGGAGGVGGATGGAGMGGAAIGTTGVAATTALTKAVVVGLATGVIALGGAAWSARRSSTRPVAAPLAATGPSAQGPSSSAAALAPESPSRELVPASSMDPGAVATAPTSTASAPTSRRPASSVGTAPPANVAAADVSAVEMDLLRRAQTELSRRPDAALSLCSEHERRFPSGGFAEEREVIAIDALSRLGRRAESSTRAERFLASHPRSGHRPRVEALLHPP